MGHDGWEFTLFVCDDGTMKENTLRESKKASEYLSNDFANQ